MRFALTDDQVALRDAVRNLLDKQCPPSSVRVAWIGGPGYDSALWSELGTMGLFGLLVPEESGGLGLTPIELAVVMEECGRAALPGPVVEQAAAALPLVAADPRLAERWLEPALSGQQIVTFGPVGDLARTGSAGTPWGAEAALCLVEAGGTLVAASPSEIVGIEHLDCVDRSWRMARLTVEGAHAVADGEAAARAAWERGVLASSAMLIGLGARLVEMTVGYVKERRQFGVPIGSFQAVKHHLANAHLAVEYARPAVWRAAYSMAHEEPDLQRDVSFAKVYANRAASLAARLSLQCHGAIGYSYESDLHLWLKRVWTLTRLWGGTDAHRARVAGAVIGP